MCEVQSGRAGTKSLALGKVVVARILHEKAFYYWTIGLELCSIMASWHHGIRHHGIMASGIMASGA